MPGEMPPTDPRKAPPKKVLVVDDDESLCKMLATFLSKHGYTVFTAPDAPSALGTLDFHGDIRVVLTDLMMPMMTGIQFVEMLKADPTKKNVHVILMTAYPEDVLFERGLRKGVALTLTKPIDFNQLLALVGFAA